MKHSSQNTVLHLFQWEIHYFIVKLHYFVLKSPFNNLTWCILCSECSESWWSLPVVQHFYLPQPFENTKTIINNHLCLYIEYSGVTHSVTVPFPWKSVVHKSASVTTKCHWLVLQVTLSTLITYRAVQWMIYQQKLHHSLPGGKNMDWRNILKSSCLYITLKPTAATNPCRMLMLDLSAQDVPVLHIPNQLRYSNSTHVTLYM